MALTQEIQRLAEEADAPRETLELVASGASIASATAEAAAALLGLADAVELGLLSPEFGVAVGPLFSQAELRLTEA